MANIILKFPIRKVVPLSCVWIETGNPGQPLACRWTARPTGADLASPETTEPERRRRWA